MTNEEITAALANYNATTDARKARSPRARRAARYAELQAFAEQEGAKIAEQIAAAPIVVKTI